MSSQSVPPESPIGVCSTYSASALANESLHELATMSAKPKILIVDDDISLGKFLSRELTRSHFFVEISRDGEAACDKLTKAKYDLLVLDLNLPGMDGMAVMKQVRLSNPRLPILVLTARNRTEDLVSALEKGADDCLIKPFSLLELRARVRCLLRRSSEPVASSANVGNVTINRDEHWAMRGDRRIDLTVREFDLLEFLMNNVGKAVSRKTLMEEVWNIPYDSTTNIVDVYMKYLRDKVDLEGDLKLIRTVRGVGYVFSND